MPLRHRRRIERRRRLSRLANRRKLRPESRQIRSLARPNIRPNIRRSVRPSIKGTMSTVSHDQQASQFTTEVDGYRAELDYTLAGTVMTIAHTRVPQAIGGRGVAADLMRAALAEARAAGWSV